jgi:uncharacterized protein
MKKFPINVTSLLNFEEPSRKVSFSGKMEPIEFYGDKISFSSNLKVEVEIKRIGKGLEVRGSSEGKVNLMCSRCLKKFPYLLNFSIDEIFIEKRMEKLIPKDSDFFLIEKESIDLYPMLRQLIIVNLPIKPLCQVDCKGICPKCGADLNKGKCNCIENEIDVRWEPLKKLKNI